MKKVLIAVICAACAVAFSTQAQDAQKAQGGSKKGHKMTEEQKTLWKSMVAKYDTNGDKKLDKEERAKISAEDKEKLEKAGLGKKQGKKASK